MLLITFHIHNERVCAHKQRLPNEVRAVAAEGRLLEKPRSKFVVFHFVDVFLAQSTFACKSISDRR